MSRHLSGVQKRILVQRPNADSVWVIFKNFINIVGILEEINEPEAFVVLSSNTSFNFPFCYTFGISSYNIIQNQRLQDPKINFKNASQDIDGLKDVLKRIRDAEIDEIATQGKNTTEAVGIGEQRMRKRKTQPGEEPLT